MPLAPPDAKIAEIPDKSIFQMAGKRPTFNKVNIDAAREFCVSWQNAVFPR
jgi:hypothetical protein